MKEIHAEGKFKICCGSMYYCDNGKILDILIPKDCEGVRGKNSVSKQCIKKKCRFLKLVEYKILKLLSFA